MDARYEALIRGRTVRTSRPAAIELVAGDAGALRPMSGAVTVLLYRVGARSEAQANAAAGGDRDALADLLTAAEANKARLLRRVASGQVAGQLGLVADVRYGAKTLRQGLTLPHGVDVVLDQYRFAGGQLDLERFQLLEYADPSDPDDYGAIVVVGQPQLSDLERQIVTRLPADLSELAITEADQLWPNVLAAAIDRLAGRNDLVGDNIADRAVMDRLADRLAQRQVDDLNDRLADRLVDRGIAERLAQRRLADDLQDRLVDRLADQRMVQDLADRLADRLADQRLARDVPRQQLQRVVDPAVVDRLAQRLAEQQLADRIADRLAQRIVDDLGEGQLADRVNQIDQAALADRLADIAALDDLGAGAFGRQVELPGELLDTLAGLDPGAAVKELLAVRSRLARRQR